MRKIILLFILTFNLIIFTNVLKNVKAEEVINEIEKPLILLKGYNYDEYLNYENYTIIQNNLNINKIGEYKIVYQNDLTGDEYTKRIYVKSEEDLVSDKCYSDDYLPLYGSTSRMIVHKYLYHNGFYYFAISEEVNDDLFNMYLVKLENEEIVFKKTIASNISGGSIGDFIINGEEIVLLINYPNEENLNVMIKIISDSGIDLYEKTIIGNKYDLGRKIIMYNGSYYFAIESLSTTGEIYQSVSTTKNIYILKMNINTRSIINCGYKTDTYDLNIIDVIGTSDGILFLTKKFDSSIRLQTYEFYLFDYNNLSLIKSNVFKKTLAEDCLKFSKNINNQIYLMMTSYDYKIKGNKYNLYLVNSYLNAKLMNSYYYEKNPNAVLCDFIVNDHNNIEVLYSLTDTTKDDIYGYMYHIIENNEVVLEIENFDSTMMCDGFVNRGEILFYNSKSIIRNKINYVAFTNLNNNPILDDEELNMYPILYVDGRQIYLDKKKSYIEYDLNVFGKYDVKYYYTTDNVDIIVGGNIEVKPKINIVNDGIYDVNLKLEFNGKGVLNNYQIENGYMILKPGSYTLEVIGKDEESYKLNFEVQETSSNQTIVKDGNISLNTSTAYLDNVNELVINNNISQSDISNVPNKLNWIYILPICSLVVLMFSIVKKRG